MRPARARSASRCPNATARAGNVIGGGDWADHRLIPDCVRAYLSSSAVILRYPQAVRPWQHVFESISGYIQLAEHLSGENGSQFASAWNFGPDKEDIWSVVEVASKACQLLNVPIQIKTQSHNQPEATLLMLDSSKANEYLNWKPQWPLQKTIDETIAWYHAWWEGKHMLQFSKEQIQRYQEVANG